jgi:hypothetical protein
MEPVQTSVQWTKTSGDLRGIHEPEHLRGVHAIHWTSAPGGQGPLLRLCCLYHGVPS